jgi:hypothetical protein
LHWELDLVDRRLVVIEILGQSSAELLQLLGAADRPFVAVLANPERQRRAPIPVTRDVPVDVVLEPLTETLLDLLGHPIHSLVARDHLRLELRGADIPSRRREIEERRAAAPTVRIAVTLARLLEDESARLEVFHQRVVGFLEERPGFDRSDVDDEASLRADGLQHRQAVLLSDRPIVRTIAGRLVNDARAVFDRDILRRVDTSTRRGVRLPRTGFDARDRSVEERSIAQTREFAALPRLEHFDRVAEHGFRPLLDDPEDLVAPRARRFTLSDRERNSDALILALGMNGECDIRRQGPRRGGPREQTLTLLRVRIGENEARVDTRIHHIAINTRLSEFV